MTEITNLVDSNSDGKVPVLLPLSDANTLVTINGVKNGKYMPIGRSYDGHDWERVAGPEDTLGYLCETNGSVSPNRLCQVYLPIDDEYDGTTYHLTAYDHQITESAEIARFLTTTTFGPTKSDIDGWSSSFGTWVEDQITNAGTTSHREYYRKRLNPRSIQTYIYGLAGPQACEANSRWRRFAFTSKDLFMSNVDEVFNVSISTVVAGSETGYVLSFAGSVRTVLTTPLEYYSSLDGTEDDYYNNQGSTTIGGQLDMASGSYKICALEEIEGSNRDESTNVDLPRTFGLEVANGTCSYIVGGNPTVNLDSRFVNMSNMFLLDLSNLDDTSDIVEINKEITKGSDLLLTRSVKSDNENVCASFPDPTDNDFRGPDEEVVYAVSRYIGHTASKFSPDQPVFSLLPDGGYALYDLRLTLDENTIDSPMMDGGGNKVVAAGHGDEQVYFCSNVPMNIFNEDSCKLSYRENTCTRYDESITSIKNRQGGTIVCGSEGEVAPDPQLDDFFDVTNRYLDSSPYHKENRQTVWTQIALSASDQLRQRVAWALSQIFIVSPNAVNDPFNTETHLHYYDTFVRNAFGNYREVFRRAAFHPRMGKYLTFAGSASIAYDWHSWNIIRHPDENFARECWQLFSIGLVKLNMDGTAQLDRNGIEIKTYDTKDIVSFARAWTGFWYHKRRGNYEDLTWNTVTNFMDPMKIEIRKRDIFPKRALDGAFIGDRYPLCTDIPSRAFLRQGAKYRLLGSSSSPLWQDDEAEWNGDETTKRVHLSAGSSALYNKLCHPDESNTCHFEPTITLDTNLACHGVECSIDTVRVVQVGNIFYEYLRQPCVQHAFYEGGKKVMAGWNNEMAMCAHPKMAVATEACCDNSDEDAQRPCEYVGERLSFDSNVQRCSSLGLHACDPKSIVQPTFDDGTVGCNDHSGSNTSYADKNVFHWTTESCSLRVLVQDTGLIAIEHNPNKTHNVYNLGEEPVTAPHVSYKYTKNYFSVNWEKNATGDDIFPSDENNCGDWACGKLEDGTCFCNVTVSETAVFSAMPTRDDVLLELSIGAFAPEMYDDGDYELFGSVDGVDAFRLSGASDDFTKNTVFKVSNEQRETIYLKNMRSTATIADLYDISNPPHFIDLVDPEVRDAYYETEAVLDNYLYHANTAPFVSKKLIQRFGISNPSPRYVETVAKAFQAGSFEWTDGSEAVTFGDNKWGNLAATVAAIILDREAASVSLDADPAQGSIREPLLKVIGFMKSMEYSKTKNARNKYPILQSGASIKIGQMAYEAPDVFSFFSPEYVPSGTFSEASLVSPEAEALSQITTNGISIGLFSLIRHGMNGCGNGLGVDRWGCHLISDPTSYLPSLNYNNSVGYLAYSPEAAGESAIDELALLLTSGRLTDDNRQSIIDAYNTAYASEGEDVALQVAQQLISTTPEFHTTSIVRKTGSFREATPMPESNGESYKAIVFMFLFGGMDSFYLLSPHSSCSLYAEYAEARGEAAALTEDHMLSIDASSSTDEQPCTMFGVNKHLSIFKTIYDDGNGVFLANTGHMSKPVSRYNYMSETKTQLFSHNSMENEAYVVDPFHEKTGTGAFGRMLDVLATQGYSVGPIGIDSAGACLNGDPEQSRKVDVIRRHGLWWFYNDMHKVSEALPPNTMRAYFAGLNGETELNSGLFGNHWSQEFIDMTDRSDRLGTLTYNTALSMDWIGEPEKKESVDQLKMVSKLIKTHEARGTDRDVFYVRLTGYDTHSNMKTTLDSFKFPDINNGIENFYYEMESAGMIDSITFVLASEFARTVSANTGKGTDHAWGGNYFIFGGEINGGQIFGNYPSGFSENDPTNDGRGRFIPTTPWDSPLNAISQWFGITSEEDLNYVLPNRNNFGCRLLTDKDLYNGGEHENEGCDGDEIEFEQSLTLSEARYLTGYEQKTFCEALVDTMSSVLTSNTVRCVVTDQFVEEVTDARSRELQSSFSINFITEISASDMDFGETVSTHMADKEADIVTKMQSKKSTKRNKINLGDVKGVKTKKSRKSMRRRRRKNEPQPTPPPTTSPTSAPTGDPSNHCCSVDMKTCIRDTWWCGSTEAGCNWCRQHWILPPQDDCTPRWNRCSDDSDCCSGLICYGNTHCVLPGRTYQLRRA